MTQTIFDVVFTPEDLAANQRGERSAPEQARIDSLLRSAQGVMRWMAFWIYGLVVVGTGIGFINAQLSVPNFFAEAGLPILIATGGLTGVLLFAGFTQWLNDRGLRSGRIWVVEGMARTWERKVNTRSGTLVQYRLKISGRRRKTFTFMDGSSLRMFTNGKEYKVYYIPYAPFPIVLSAEQIA